MSADQTHQGAQSAAHVILELDYEKIDWQASYKTIIARIIGSGGPQQREELSSFYGEVKVINALKNEIRFLLTMSSRQPADTFLLPNRKVILQSQTVQNSTLDLIKTLMADQKLENFLWLEQPLYH